jgi:hypothetical protein
VGALFIIHLWRKLLYGGWFDVINGSTLSFDVGMIPLRIGRFASNDAKYLLLVMQRIEFRSVASIEA